MAGRPSNTSLYINDRPGAAAGVGFGAKKCFMVLHPCAVACSGVHGFKAGAMEDLENAALCRRLAVSGKGVNREKFDGLATPKCYQ